MVVCHVSKDHGRNILLILCVSVVVCHASKGHGRNILLILCVFGAVCHAFKVIFFLLLYSFYSVIVSIILLLSLSLSGHFFDIPKLFTVTSNSFNETLSFFFPLF